MGHVLKTAIFSLIVQVIAGIFLVLGFFYKLHPDDMVLKTIITMELVVQIIEGFFYIFLIKMLSKGIIDTKYRYYDWFFSTPIMLISTMLFLKYLHKKPVDVKETFKEEKWNVVGIVLLNAMMLVIGFLGEKNIIGKYPAFVVGTGFLVGAFAFLYKDARMTKNGKIFLGIMFGIWALYGVAFLMPLKMKNSSYNILDLFAKNFYGIFLYFVILAKYGRIV